MATYFTVLQLPLLDDWAVMLREEFVLVHFFFKFNFLIPFVFFFLFLTWSHYFIFSNSLCFIPPFNLMLLSLFSWAVHLKILIVITLLSNFYQLLNLLMGEIIQSMSHTIIYNGIFLV